MDGAVEGDKNKQGNEKAPYNLTDIVGVVHCELDTASRCGGGEFGVRWMPQLKTFSLRDFLLRLPKILWISFIIVVKLFEI